jgi:phosphoadenosine phosphosulfate reductase
MINQLNMSGTKGMLRDFNMYPKFQKLYLNAFDNMLEARNNKGLKTDWKTSNDVMNWWIN